MNQDQTEFILGGGAGKIGVQLLAAAAAVVAVVIMGLLIVLWRKR